MENIDLFNLTFSTMLCTCLHHFVNQISFNLQGKLFFVCIIFSEIVTLTQSIFFCIMPQVSICFTDDIECAGFLARLFGTNVPRKRDFRVRGEELWINIPK